MELSARMAAEEKAQALCRKIPAKDDTRRGTVYLICFATPFSHARHYLGWTTDLEARIARHRSGRGAKLMAYVEAAGIGWDVTGIWRDMTRTDERAIKDRRRTPQYCPRCRKHLSRELPGLRKHPLPEPYGRQAIAA